MKWKPKDAQERKAVAIAGVRFSTLGHIFREQGENDVGIDAHVELVTRDTHAATGQLIALQIKGGPSYFKETTATGAIFRGALEHLDYWFNHSLPVFLLLVDTEKQKAYWQEITAEKVKRLAKGWKVEVPFVNEVEKTFNEAARRRTGLDPAAAIYTRLKLDDTSNSTIKHYTAQILVRHPVSRLRMEAVMRRATFEIRKETFHRSPGLRHLADHEAEVVSLYLAADPSDAANANWLSRTLWINPALQGVNRPVPLGGLTLGDGLEVIWNPDCDYNGRFLKDAELDKQTFLTDVIKFLAATERLITETFATGDRCIVDGGAAVQKASEMRQVYFDSTRMGLHPYECRDVADRFNDVMALADNAFMQLDPKQKAQTGSDFLIEIALRDCRKNIDRLRYEIEKVS